MKQRSSYESDLIILRRLQILKNGNTIFITTQVGIIEQIALFDPPE
ncbi:hypothetical protein [Niallia oryzisoli]